MREVRSTLGESQPLNSERASRQNSRGRGARARSNHSFRQIQLLTDCRNMASLGLDPRRGRSGAIANGTIPAPTPLLTLQLPEPA